MPLLAAIAIAATFVVGLALAAAGDLTATDLLITAACGAIAAALVAPGRDHVRRPPARTPAPGGPG